MSCHSLTFISCLSLCLAPKRSIHWLFNFVYWCQLFDECSSFGKWVDFVRVTVQQHPPRLSMLDCCVCLQKRSVSSGHRNRSPSLSGEEIVLTTPHAMQAYACRHTCVYLWVSFQVLICHWCWHRRFLWSIRVVCPQVATAVDSTTSEAKAVWARWCTIVLDCCFGSDRVELCCVVWWV